MRDEVVDHHAEIGFRPVEDREIRAAREPRGVEARDQPLPRRLFVAGGAVDLSRQEQARQALGMEGGVEFARIDVIVLDGVAGPHDTRALQPRDGGDDASLNRLRQRRRDAVRIDDRVVETFRLEEDLVSLAVAEANHLVFDRGAVAGTAAADTAGIHRRPVEVCPNEIVDGRRRAGDAAGDLGRGDALGQRRERHGFLIRVLHLQGGPVDRATVEARRRPGLQPAEAEAVSVERIGEADRRPLPHAAGGDLRLADMDQPAQEGARGNHHGRGRDASSIRKHGACDAARLDDQVVGLALDDGQPVRFGDSPLHGAGIECPVGLGARAAHGRSLATVEQAELYAGDICDAAHQSVEGIDLTNEVALAEAADGGIAGHRADGRGPMGDERRSGAGPRGCRSRFDAGMAAADDDHVVAGRDVVHGLCLRMPEEGGQRTRMR